VHETGFVRVNNWREVADYFRDVRGETHSA